MLHVYAGLDSTRARKKVQATIASLRTKSPEAVYLRIFGNECVLHDPYELSASQALFKNTYLVFIDSVCGTKEGATWLAQALPLFAESKHVFFLLEETLPSAIQKLLEKHEAKITLFEQKNAPVEKVPTDSFALSDALLARDKARVWTIVLGLLRAGVPAEEIHGSLFWAAKTILLAHTAHSAEDAGLKPYPFLKAQKSAKLFSRTDAEALLCALALAPARAYAKGVGLDIELEKTILELV